jgi:hypothetical protein
MSVLSNRIARLRDWGQSLMTRHGRKAEGDVVPLQVLCRFWQEDGVWNATTEHLAVAVFGDTFEDAQKNLQDAIVAHMECWVESGKAKELIALLESRAHGRLEVEKICPDVPLVKMQIEMKDHNVFNFVHSFAKAAG